MKAGGRGVGTPWKQLGRQIWGRAACAHVQPARVDKAILVLDRLSGALVSVSFHQFRALKKRLRRGDIRLVTCRPIPERRA